MAVLETTLVYFFALIVCLKLVVKRFPGAAAHIFGLKIFAVREAESPATSATSKTRAPPASAPCVRTIGLADVRALARPLAPFNNAVACAFALAVQSALGEALSRGFGRASSPWLVSIAAMCLGYSLMYGLLPAAAARVSVAGQFQQAQTVFVVCCAVGLTLVLTVLLSMPAVAIDVSGARAAGLQDALRFWKDVYAVIGALPHSLSSLVDSRNEIVTADADEPVELQAPRALLATWSIGLATCAGAYCATLVLPLVRFARCTSAALFPSSVLLAAPEVVPCAVDMPLQPTGMTSMGIRLAVAAPPLACLLWMKPLIASLAQESADAAAALQAAALVLCGLLHLAVARPLLQSYFSSALLRWCQLHCKLQTDSAKAAGPSSSRTDQAVRASIGNTNALFPSVLVQLTMPGIVMFVAGVLLWDAAAWGRTGIAPKSAVGGMGDESAFQVSLVHFISPPRGLVQVGASTLGLSALLTHSVCVAGWLSLGRLGVFE